jgi:hypothetical protein
MVDKLALGRIFFRVLQFSLPILIPPTAPYLLIILSWKVYRHDTDSVIKYKSEYAR